MSRPILSAVPANSRFDLSGKVALVTGASRGIGSATAHTLAEAGAHVVLSSRKQADLDAEAERINQAFPGRASAVAAHAGREEDLGRLVSAVMERHGRIDILVNNAGTNPYMGPLMDAELSAWDKTFEVNVRGIFILTQLVYRAWMGEHGGSIVNVASTGGLRPGLGLGVYRISKAAVVFMTRQLAREIGGNVRVNAVAPGLIKTRFAEALWANEEVLERILAPNPMGRIGTVDEVANAVLFLASDAATYVNGEVMVVDGGGGEV
jgi:NAD(P)-dependent dehydrogenase (short-subunit alcohol dehydrogenase family)